MELQFDYEKHLEKTTASARELAEQRFGKDIVIFELMFPETGMRFYIRTKDGRRWTMGLGGQITRFEG